MAKKDKNVALDPSDLEAIEGMIYRNGDDIAVAIARSLERLEEKMEATEHRIHDRLTDFANDLKSELAALRLLAEGDSEVVIGEK